MLDPKRNHLNPASVMRIHVLILGLAGLSLAACGGGSSGGGLSLTGSVDSTTKDFIKAVGTWDADRDGIVTCDEWKAYATRQFSAADGNADLSLDAREYSALSGRDALFHTVKSDFFDANRNGQVSRDEFVNKPNPAFTRLDANKDCGLTLAERAVVPTKKRKPTIGDREMFPGEARGEGAVDR